MAKSYIDELRGLGATEKELKELRQLQQQFEEEDLYSKIEQKNKRILGEAIRPADISYETAYNAVKYGAYGSVSQYNEEYKREARLHSQGTTTDIEMSYNDMSSRLKDHGIDITHEELLEIRDINQDLYDYITVLLDLSYRYGNDGGYVDSHGRNRIAEIEVIVKEGLNLKRS